MINTEQKERILALYLRDLYGYKKVARALGLTRDQVKNVIHTAIRKGIKLNMAKFSPDNESVKKTASVYEDRDLSECTSDADKIAYLQDENRLLRALLVEYQKEFLPEALTEYPAFQSQDVEDEQDTTLRVGKKPKRSLKKKNKKTAQDRGVKQLFFDAMNECKRLGKISRYCEMGHVSRAGFYKHSVSSKNDGDKLIADEVIKIQLEHGFRVGILKTRELLARRGIIVGHNRLGRIMSKYELHPQFNKKRYPAEYYAQKKESKKSQERVNVLNREFVANSPGEKLVTDMTYIRVTEGWLYLSPVIDLFTRDVLAYEISDVLNVDFAIKTLETLGNTGFAHKAACIFHSDQGFTYTHERYINKLKEYGFTQSFSRVGNCWDNACAENFFSHLKAELEITHQKKLLSHAEMKAVIENYIEYYRTKRIQANLGYRTPQEVLIDYQKSLK